MPRLRLPPLPPAQEWGSMLKNRPTSKSASEGMLFREVQRRVWLVNPTLTNLFVRDLGVRKDEVFLEAYAGLGTLTRALLAGGYDKTTPKDWERVRKEQEIAPPEDDGKVKRHPSQFKYPPWDIDLAAVPELPEKEDGEVVTPALVVANDPSASMLSRGLGFLPGVQPKEKWDFEVPSAAEVQRLVKESDQELYPSVFEKNLVVAPNSVYHWPTLPRILSDKLVSDKLPVWDESKEGDERYYRPWDAPEPHITMTAVMQDSVLGEQLLNQWVSSAIGSPKQAHSWIWKWGRIRFAFLVPRHMYDRLMAKDGEASHCKMSVMASALFNLRPLPPYHHVPDVDKGSTRTDPRIDAPRPVNSATGKRSTTPAAPPTSELTKTLAGDFYPISSRLQVSNRTGKRSTLRATSELSRSALLGIEMIPRVDSPIVAEQREVWDFVLRKLFVREAATLQEMLSTLAFGAENLLPKLEQEDSPYKGVAVPGGTTIRNIHEQQWLRIVDVFDKWAFRPEMMHYDLEMFEDSREVGMS